MGKRRKRRRQEPSVDRPADDSASKSDAPDWIASERAANTRARAELRAKWGLGDESSPRSSAHRQPPRGNTDEHDTSERPTNTGEMLASLAMTEIAVVARDERIRMQAKARRDRRQRLAFPVLAVLALALTVMNAIWLSAPAPDEPHPAELRREMLAALRLVAMDMEDYRRQQGSFLDRQQELGMPDESQWSLVVLTPSRYRLSYSRADQTVVYDSMQDWDSVFASVEQPG